MIRYRVRMYILEKKGRIVIEKSLVQIVFIIHKFLLY